MSLYKGFLAYLVYLYLEFSEVVHVIAARSENRSPDIVSDVEQVLIHFISENDYSGIFCACHRYVVQPVTRRRWMFGKASSSQAPSVSKRSFGSSLSVDCQSVFYLLSSWSFPRDLGNGKSVLREQHAFYFIIHVQCLKYYNRWH